MSTDLSQIRQGFSDPFLLDAIVRHTCFRQIRLMDHGFHQSDLYPLTKLAIPGETLHKATNYLVEKDVLIRDEDFLRLGKHGQDFYDVTDRFDFDGGLPSWDYLTRDQVGTVLTTALEQPRTFPGWNCSPHIRGGVAPIPGTTPIDEALNRGLINMSVKTDLKSTKPNLTLVHFLTVKSLDPIANLQDFQGYVGGTSHSLTYEGIWSGPVEVQREIYERTRDCAEALRDLYPEKQV